MVFLVAKKTIKLKAGKFLSRENTCYAILQKPTSLISSKLSISFTEISELTCIDFCLLLSILRTWFIS